MHSNQDVIEQKMSKKNLGNKLIARAAPYRAAQRDGIAPQPIVASTIRHEDGSGVVERHDWLALAQLARVGDQRPSKRTAVRVFW